MIAALGIWIYITYSTLTNGLLMRKILSKLFNIDNKLSFSMTILLGFTFTTTVASFLSLFMKTGLVSNLILFITGTGFLLFDKKENSKILSKYISSLSETHWATWILGAGFMFLVFHQTTSITLNADTPLYHALSIRFIEDYSVIPGLGNFYHRLGFNNSWFVTGALYGLSFLNIQSFNVLGHFMMIFSGFFILGGLNNIINGRRFIGDWARLLLMPVFLYSWYFPHIGWTSSPSPDIPAALLTWYIFTKLITVYQKEGKLKFEMPMAALLMVSFFLVTIKLSAAPVALPLLYIAFKQLKINSRNFIFAAVLSLVILMPWMSRNFMVSGYIIHPFPAIDIADTEWKIPNERALKEKEEIQRWAKWPGWFKKPEGKKLEDLSYSEWYDVWYANQTLPYLKIIFYSTFVFWGFYLLSFIWGVVKNKNELESKLDEFVIMMSMIIGWAYWWYTAPDLRFGWGFMFINLSIFTVYFLSKAFKVLIKSKIEHTAKLGTSIGVLALVIFGYNFYKHYDLVSQRYEMFNGKVSSERVFLPADYQISYALKMQEINGVEVFFENNVNYPPLPGLNNINHAKSFEMISDKIEDGFKYKENESK